ncbi:MAG TPA: hypothetical protein P5205_18745 [Candidatus Paceibacterota bacterium]|nr:hypothetical protein [Candidatus Paceibacterota bacterium]
MKKSIAVLFQAAISQGWCQRNNSGRIRMKNTTPTTLTVVKSNGLASK